MHSFIQESKPNYLVLYFSLTHPSIVFKYIHTFFVHTFVCLDGFPSIYNWSFSEQIMLRFIWFGNISWRNQNINLFSLYLLHLCLTFYPVREDLDFFLLHSSPHFSLSLMQINQLNTLSSSLHITGCTMTHQHSHQFQYITNFYLKMHNVSLSNVVWVGEFPFHSAVERISCKHFKGHEL